MYIKKSVARGGRDWFRLPRASFNTYTYSILFHTHKYHVKIVTIIKYILTEINRLIKNKGLKSKLQKKRKKIDFVQCIRMRKLHDRVSLNEYIRINRMRSAAE